MSNFMGNFKDKLIRFMYGRYGVDQLYYTSMIVSFILLIVNSIVRSPIIGIIVWAILAWMIFRTFSRNVYKRRMENEKFLKLWNVVKTKWSLTGHKIKESKTHRYRKCPHCKAVLRLPRKKGHHAVDCPRCHKEFKVRVRF